MKQILCCIILLAGTFFYGADENINHNYNIGLSRRASNDLESDKDYVGYSNEADFSSFDREKSNAYNMSVTPPSGAIFIQNSSCSGEVTVDAASLVAGKKLYAKNSIPTGSYIIEMSGSLQFIDGNGGPGNEKNASWGAYVRNRYFWIDPAEAVIPEGQSVSFTAKESGSNKQSWWKIDGIAPKDNPLTSSIIFNRSWWDIAGWFDTGVDTPKPGAYTIEATADGTNKKAQANLTIVSAEFKEHNNHSYGFDDYTKWNKNAADYYGSKTGKCTLPYASVKSGSQGRSNFVLTPTQIPKDIEFSLSTNLLDFSPHVTKSNTEVVLDATSNGLSSSAATLRAKLDGTTIANLEVYSFGEITKKVLVVFVIPTAQTTISTPDAVKSINLIKVYRQVVFNIVTQWETFIYSAGPNIWTATDRRALKQTFVRSPPVGISLNNYDHIFFVISGSDSQRALAWGEVGGKFLWIYTSANYPYVGAHELGHNYGLVDQYTIKDDGTVITGKDKYNLMNAGMPQIINMQFRLRKEQWTKIRE